MQQRAKSGDKLHHEDLAVGEPYAFGHKVVTAEEVIAFGRAFDPQPMHTDPEAAKATPVGGLCASGWHTCAMMMRMVADGLLGRAASLGSPGIDEVRWKRPVRPGDVLSMRYTVQEKRVLASRPDVGLAKVLVELVDATGEVPALWLTNQLTRVRHPEAAPAATAAKPKAEAAPTPSLWDGTAGIGEGDAFFEDRVIGEMGDLGSHTFTREEIIDFARQFDPQPFHLDEEAAKASLFGALCASGWHTAAHLIRAIIVTRQRINAGALARGARLATYGPSPGFRDLRWPKPVYVGDTVSYRSRLIEKIDLKSRPNRGLLANAVEGRNQKGEIVFAVISLILADRREPLRV
ncbi:MAG: MaoC family dehydratase [Hyphomicrobiaceae bacterium]|nr:MaoC family dehydratase [Hyphomicrobiaceae bacterium]